MRVAVVTGAAGGMGRAIVARLLVDGLSVVGLDIEGEALEGRRVARGERFTPATVDLTDVKAIGAVFDAIAVQFGGVDALVNNAGTCLMSNFPEILAAELDSCARPTRAQPRSTRKRRYASLSSSI